MVKGLFCSIIASSLFGGLYYFSILLLPLNGEQIFGWRILTTLPCITLILWYGGLWPLVTKLWRRLKKHPILIPSLLLSAALVGVQMWLFMWAPLQGRGLQVSLGYFLLPLCMLIIGRFLYKDHLSPLQIIATLCAIIGVAHELFQIGYFSWEPLLVAIGYPLYFMLRRYLRTNHLGGFWFDIVIICPFALYFLQPFPPYLDQFAAYPKLFFLLPMLGLISGCALISYIIASKELSFSLFGLLSYVEPILLVIVSLLLGEHIKPSEWLTYIPIWLAVCFLALDGIKQMLNPIKNRLSRK